MILFLFGSYIFYSNFLSDTDYKLIIKYFKNFNIDIYLEVFKF